MTCKDCLGNYLGYCKFYCLCPDKCENFQDRSEWVKLPCKVGDTMYCDGKFFADHCKGEVMSFPVDIILTEVCSTFRGEIDMVFDFKAFGKDVFLTREEAERALKERESNDE